MSHKGHKGTQGWQGSQNPNDVPDPGAHGGYPSEPPLEEYIPTPADRAFAGDSAECLKESYPEEERIDPAFDLSKNQLNKMVEEALAGTDFSAVLDTYFKEMEDQITKEIHKANEGQAGGFNLGSLSACRFIAGEVVNNVLRVPHEEEETHE